MRRLLLIIGIATLVFACKKSKKSDKEDTKTDQIEISSDQLKSILDSNITQANTMWDSVIIADDNKMADIKRLLDEISYTESSDEKRLKELYALFEEVQKMRYTQRNVNGTLIDAYDEAQDKLISSANALAESTPNIESHPLAIELMNDIVEADGMTFSKRGDYDIYAKRVNWALKQHSAKVKELGKPYENLNKLGIFGFEN